MDKEKINALDVLLSSKKGQSVRILIKVRNGMPDEVAVGEIHHLTDNTNTPVLVMTNVRLEKSVGTYNIDFNEIADIQFLAEETVPIKKAAT